MVQNESDNHGNKAPRTPRQPNIDIQLFQDIYINERTYPYWHKNQDGPF
jgi:hypothetical protein